jgi:hypothetical protein
VRLPCVGTNGDGVNDAAERNVISANTLDGLGIATGANQNTVAGNYIGADVTGAAALGNAGNGVVIGFAAQSNPVGATGVSGNTIAFNADAGVVAVDGFGFPDSLGNFIQGNSIHSNGGLGIDLGLGVFDPVSTKVNDAGDIDTGSNDLQNYPLIQQVTTGVATQIKGFLNSQPNTTYTLEFYANTTLDLSGFGEGELYLGLTTVVMNASGDVSFDVTLPAATVAGDSSAPQRPTRTGTLPSSPASLK